MNGNPENVGFDGWASFIYCPYTGLQQKVRSRLKVCLKIWVKGVCRSGLRACVTPLKIWIKSLCLPASIFGPHVCPPSLDFVVQVHNQEWPSHALRGSKSSWHLWEYVFLSVFPVHTRNTWDPRVEGFECLLRLWLPLKICRYPEAQGRFPHLGTSLLSLVFVMDRYKPRCSCILHVDQEDFKLVATL